MIHYFKFHRDVLAPAAGRAVVHKPGKGKGWPEECPPIRAANAFGFDLLANFDLDLRYARGKWVIEDPITVESDFMWAADERSEGAHLRQDYAWFWEKGQKLPHVISDNVYAVIRHQVKVSTFLYMATDPGEVLLLTDVPNMPAGRGFRAASALIETDWYPASYPWHCVLELNPGARRVHIARGEPLCRLIPLSRGRYRAKQMGSKAFDAFFERGQRWLREHGRPHECGGEHMLDITRRYGRQQRGSVFEV